jgi:SAM-dependent methyltransferase
MSDVPGLASHPMPEDAQSAPDRARFASYFAYLRKRSRLGYLYRRFWLYPVLSRQLKGRVLDVGCGIGDFLAFRPGSVGVDINPLTVEWCRSRGLDARVMERGRIPYDDASFDSVVLDNVLEHIADPTPLLAEVFRVLAPGGILLLGVPGPRGFSADPDHKVFYDENALVYAAMKSGFDRLRILHLPLRAGWLATRISQYCLYGVFCRRSASHPA